MTRVRGLFSERLIRMTADAIILNVAWLGAFIIRVMITLWFQSNELGEFTSYGQLMEASLSAYLKSAVPLTAISLVVFYLSGFYTFGRTYRGRYKFLIILEAISLAFLLFWFAWSFLHVYPPLSRGAIVIGWVSSLTLLAGARLLATLSAHLIQRDDRIFRALAIKVERVLVVGGAGYLGSVLVKKLLMRGHHVRVLDALLYGDGALSELHRSPRFQFFHGDFRNVETIVRASQGVDAVVHLGAIVGDPASGLDEEVTREVNVAATRLIAEVARGFGTRRFVFASTCSVYGASADPLDEWSALSPQTVYDRTKLQAERALLSMVDKEFAPVVLRLATLCGLSYRPRFDLVVNLLTAKAVCDRKISVFGGQQWRPFVHVDDAAEAVILCLEAAIDVVRGQVFNVGSTQQNYRILQVAKLIAELIPGTSIEISEDQADEKNYYVLCDKISRLLGFQPKKTIRDAILEIHEAFTQRWITDYQANEYNNFRFLESARSTRLVRSGNGYINLLERAARALPQF